MKVIMIENVDSELHQKFKVYCSQKGVTLRKCIIDFMKKKTKDVKLIKEGKDD
jgi:hypothetical protein